MKTRIIAVTLVVASAAAMAESPLAAGPVNQTTTSATTRAAVLNDVAAARADGTLLRAGEIGQAPAPFVSRRSRDEVRAELLQKRGADAHAAGYQPA